MNPRVFMMGGCLALGGCEDSPPPAARAAVGDERPGLRLCSFNVRYEGPQDRGRRAWPNRIHRVTRAVAAIDPDLLGVQEALHGQVADLRASLADYEFYGRGRGKRPEEDEYVGLFWKSRRFERLASGTFWLSDTPDVAGSKSWGNEVVRCASWVRLRDRGGGRSLLAVNTHWDHRHQGSRERAARLVAARIDALRGAGDAVCVLGDLNAVESNPAVAYLRGERVDLAGRPQERWPGGLADPFERLDADADERRTFHGWRDGRRGPWKIDHILVSREFEPLAAAIHREQSPFDEPSDHYPVWADVAREPTAAAERQPPRDPS